MKDVDTKKFIFKRLGIIETEVKDINKKLIPICTIIKGNGKSLPDQVENNTKFRWKITGALILLSILTMGGWIVTLNILLKVLKGI